MSLVLFLFVLFLSFLESRSTGPGSESPDGESGGASTQREKCTLRMVESTDQKIRFYLMFIVNPRPLTLSLPSIFPSSLIRSLSTSFGHVSSGAPSVRLVGPRRVRSLSVLRHLWQQTKTWILLQLFFFFFRPWFFLQGFRTNYFRDKFWKMYHEDFSKDDFDHLL